MLPEKLDDITLNIILSMNAKNGILISSLEKIIEAASKAEGYDPNLVPRNQSSFHNYTLLQALIAHGILERKTASTYRLSVNRTELEVAIERVSSYLSKNITFAEKSGDHYIEGRSVVAYFIRNNMKLLRIKRSADPNIVLEELGII
jgi:hypothetical protein